MLPNKIIRIYLQQQNCAIETIAIIAKVTKEQNKSYKKTRALATAANMANSQVIYLERQSARSEESQLSQKYRNFKYKIGPNKAAKISQRT